MDPKYHITVNFDGDGFSHAERGPFLLALEKWARQHTGKPVEVFLKRMADDSKLRRAMTPEERQKL